MIRLLISGLFAILMVGCASSSMANRSEFQIGSAISRNLFVDSSQFANRTIKLRLRNSSGDDDLDIGRLRQSIESNLLAAGYSISDKNFGIVMDINAFQFRTIATSNASSNKGIGVLLGGVLGYEATRRSSDIAAGSGLILGAVAGSTLEDILRSHDSRSTYLTLCDVNIGLVRKESTTNDRFIIGGNRIEYPKDTEQDKDAYTGFAMRETIRVAVYAGDSSERVTHTIGAIVDRLGRVIANLL